MMHKLFFSSLFLLNLAFMTPSMAQTAPTTAKFTVYGNCEMCKKRIEKAAMVNGVSKAIWDVDTKILMVQFDDTKVSPGRIQLAVAAVGHDTEMVRAQDKVYANLPGCCKYERPAKE